MKFPSCPYTPFQFPFVPKSRYRKRTLLVFGFGLFTVTVMLSVEKLWAASKALTVNVCGPFSDCIVSHTIVVPVRYPGIGPPSSDQLSNGLEPKSALFNTTLTA